MATGGDALDLSGHLRCLFESVGGQRKPPAETIVPFRRLGLWPGIVRQLEAIAAGHIPISGSNGIFFLAPPPGFAVDDVADCLATAINELSYHTRRKSPLVYVDFDPAPFGRNETKIEFPGARRLTLRATLDKDPAWPSTIWHEAAHIIASCGCRFLDEGWAVWCQYQFTNLSRFPVPHEDVANAKISADVAAIPLLALLEQKGGDPLFRDIVADDVETRSLYLRAYRYFDRLQQGFGLEAVASAFDRVLDGGNATDVIGREFGAAALRCEPDAQKPSLAGVERGLRSARTRMASEREFSVLANTLEEIPGASRSDNAYLRLSGLILMARLMRPQTEFRRKQLFAELSDVAQQVVKSGSDEALAELFAACLAVAQLFQPGDGDFSVHLVNATQHILNAELLAPEDGEIKLFQARLEIGKPVVDKKLVLEHLAAAASDIGYREEASALAGRLPTLNGVAYG